MIDSMDDSMTSYLAYVLAYWTNSQLLDPDLRVKYRDTKIVEWFAFWTGYYSAGGSFPLRSIEVHLPLTEDKQSHIENHSFFAVIPIGSDDPLVKRI